MQFHPDKSAPGKGDQSSPPGIWLKLQEYHKLFEDPHEYFFLVLVLLHRRRGQDGLGDLDPYFTDELYGLPLRNAAGTPPRRLSVKKMGTEEGELGPLYDLGVAPLPEKLKDIQFPFDPDAPVERPLYGGGGGGTG